MKYATYAKLQRLPSMYFTQTELNHILGGTQDSQYAVVKRLLAKRFLIRIRRGLYCLGEAFIQAKHNPYFLAVRIYGPSLISLESALSFHGLIPEAVKVVTSVTPKRSNYFTTPLGDFSYMTVPKKNFMISVERIVDGDAVYFMATPWRAMADFVYCYKKNWQDTQPLLESLRIERDEMPRLTQEEADLLIRYYDRNRVTQFLNNILKEQ